MTDAWAVHYNTPDQDTQFSTSSDPEEWTIRTALLNRIDALESGDRCDLATFTFSAGSSCCGAAGPILDAVNNALDRGAVIRFVVDSIVNTSTTYGSHSLDSLAARVSNPLTVVEDDSPFGIMHNKLGLFDYGAGNRWVSVMSWNFTGGASSFQWNIGLELRSDALYAAYLTELDELVAGRFHDDPAKSHAHSGSTFPFPGAWQDGEVYFGPHPESTTGGTNMLTVITNLLAGAEQEVYFALNKLTLTGVQDELIAAADRQVSVRGVMPQSDTNPGEDSAAVFNVLTNTLSYATTNRVNMVTAFSTADGLNTDTGHVDLVHTKYMVIDPFGQKPVLVHGSGNWTFSALMDDNSNDENFLVLYEPALVRMFYAHFKRVTGLYTNRSDFWVSGATGQVVDLWTTDSGDYTMQRSGQVPSGWSDWQSNEVSKVGRHTWTNTAPPATRFYRGLRR